MNIRYASLCSGISCESVAWMPLGWEPVFFAEIDPFACAVLKHHYPGVPNLGDIRQVDGREWRGKIDVLIAGLPCQDFSIAGDRRSLSGNRGSLIHEYARIIHEGNPAVTIFENVPGIASTPDNALGTILGEIVGAEGSVASGLPGGKWPCACVVAGPARVAAMRTLDAQFYGVAQRRRRIFIVSVRAGERLSAPFVLFEPESMPRNSAPVGQAGAELARCLTSGSGGASAKEQQLTFVSSDNVPLNALEPVCMAHGQGGAEVSVGRCPTLTCNHEAPIAFSAKDHGTDAGAVAPTLRAMQHDQSHANGSGQVAVAYPLQEIGRRPSQHGTGVGNAADPMFTLQANSQHGVAHTLRGEGHDASEDGTGRGVPLAVTFRGRDGCNHIELGGEKAYTVRAGHGGSDRPHVLSEMAVRKLTPRECERLQGLEDDYTLIPYGKGSRRKKDLAEMAEYWGVTPEVAATLAADSHRYRAIGNGMAVPVVRWLGERIELAMKLVGYVPVAERG